MSTTGRSGAPIRPLVLSRIADQGVLGLGSLLLARAMGTDAFAPVAILFVVNSLAIQVSDFGLGFAILRLPPGSVVDRGALRRLRAVGLVMVVLAGTLGLAIGARTGLLVAVTGAIWWLSAESYVRKAAALKMGRARRVATAEISGAAAFLIGVLVVSLAAPVAGWVALLFLVKFVTEIAIVHGWQPVFGKDGLRPRSGPEWLSQIFTYLVANVDYVVVAVFLGPSDLSIYVLAFRVAASAPALLSQPIMQTAFLDLAASSDERRQKVYDRIVGRVARIGAAGSVLVLVAAPVLPWLLGGQWHPVGRLLVIQSFAVPWRLLLGVTVAQGITSGQTRRVVRWEATRFVVVGLAVLVGVQAGLVWACTAVTASTILSITIEHRRSAHVGRVEVYRWLVPAAVVATGAVLLAGALLS